MTEESPDYKAGLLRVQPIPGEPKDPGSVRLCDAVDPEAPKGTFHFRRRNPEEQKLAELAADPSRGELRPLGFEGATIQRSCRVWQSSELWPHLHREDDPPKLHTEEPPGFQSTADRNPDFSRTVAEFGEQFRRRYGVDYDHEAAAAIRNSVLSTSLPKAPALPKSWLRPQTPERLEEVQLHSGFSEVDRALNEHAAEARMLILELTKLVEHRNALNLKAGQAPESLVTDSLAWIQAGMRDMQTAYMKLRRALHGSAEF